MLKPRGSHLHPYGMGRLGNYHSELTTSEDTKDSGRASIYSKGTLSDTGHAPVSGFPFAEADGKKESSEMYDAESSEREVLHHNRQRKGGA